MLMLQHQIYQYKRNHTQYGTHNSVNALFKS